MTEQLHFHFSLSCIGEGNGNPLQCSCLEYPRDGGAWWAAVYGVAQSQTRLKRLSSSSSMLEEDQLLDTSNDSDLKSMFEKTLNIRTVCIKVKVVYPEIEIKALKACFHFQNPTFEKPGLLQGLNQNKITK